MDTVTEQRFCETMKVLNCEKGRSPEPCLLAPYKPQVLQQEANSLHLASKSTANRSNPYSMLYRCGDRMEVSVPPDHLHLFSHLVTNHVPEDGRTIIMIFRLFSAVLS